MLKIELTRGQKLQIGFVAVVLGVAAFLFFRSTRAPVDMTINSWVEQHRVGVDPKSPVSVKNPADPSKATVVTVFICHDGKLEITEYTPESGLKAQFAFVPDMHRKTFDFYKDPAAKIEAISDPYKRNLEFAAYSAANNRPRGLFGKLNLDQQQLKAEREARQAMMDEVTLMDQGARTGNYHPEMYNKVMAELAAYNAKPGDPTKDAAKAKAARQVVDLALAYLDKLEADKGVSIDKYVAAMDGIFKADQKTKLGEVAKPQLVNRGRGRWGRAS